ncbi:unnamed protein product [Moneuplotes crassus]|uniref:Uncharacterized protein n=1 Tax=Euplotes crassus TaxID=5936 RepID=A0AAD1UN78_EUPCR|nr:unnamed protein product [Moneuplotes crassus]
MPVKFEKLHNAKQLIKAHLENPHWDNTKDQAKSQEEESCIKDPIKMTKTSSNFAPKRQIRKRRNMHISKLQKSNTLQNFYTHEPESGWVTKKRNPRELHERVKEKYLKTKKFRIRGGHLSKQEREIYLSTIKSSALKKEYDSLHERINTIEERNQDTEHKYRQLNSDLKEVREFVKIKNDMIEMNEKLYLNKRECKNLDQDWDIAYHILKLKDDKYKNYLKRKRAKEKKEMQDKIPKIPDKAKILEEERKKKQYQQEMNILLERHKQELLQESRNRKQRTLKTTKDVAPLIEISEIDYLEGVKEEMKLKNKANTMVETKFTLDSLKFQRKEEDRLAQEYLLKKKALEYIKSNRSEIFTSASRRTMIYKPPEVKNPQPLLISNKSYSAFDEENQLSTKEPPVRDFIRLNKHLLPNTLKSIDELYPPPSSQNLNVLSEKHGFTREEILKFYVLYKTLCKLTVTFTKDTEVRGVCFEIFINGISELSLENKDLIKRIFDKANVNKKLRPKNDFNTPW